jgi:hypothetical protein
MEYLVKIIDSTAWPLAFLVICYMLKGQLGLLAGRMSTFKYKDIEAKFEKDLAKAEAASKNIGKEPLPSQDQELWTGMTLRGVMTQWEQTKRLAQISPRAAILEAWLDVEVAISSAAKAAGINTGLSSSMKSVQQLIEIGAINNDIGESIKYLKQLRNAATHTADFTLEPTEAERYIDIALGAGNEFRRFSVSKHNKALKSDAERAGAV